MKMSIMFESLRLLPDCTSPAYVNPTSLNQPSLPQLSVED